MLSTFHGLETSRRALSTQQAALHTTGHNIANANTPGYSRQRVNFTQTEAFPSPGFNKPGIPGQLGTGVKAGEIQRVREAFLDMQFRAENNKSGYWDARHTSLSKIEDIMNEPTEDGLANTMDRFWQSLQDLSANPEDSGARSVVRQRGIALAETFNYTHDSLEAIQRDHKAQIGVQEKQINSLLTQIDNVNKQISSVEPHGMLPNDLYDQRDQLVDELSQYMNIKVERVASGGQAKDMAEGKYTISLLGQNGKETGITLVDGASLTKNQIEVNFDGADGSVNGMTFKNDDLVDLSVSDYNNFASDDQVTVNINDFMKSTGSLTAVIQAFGYDTGSFAGDEFESGNVEGLLPEMMTNLDQMVATFVAEYNDVHRAGISLSEIRGDLDDGFEGFDFFDFAEDGIDLENIQGAAKHLKITDDIKDSLDNIAAAKNVSEDGGRLGYAGDGGNALNLSDVKDEDLDFGGNSTTNVQSFYQGVIGEMAVDTNEAERLLRNTSSLRDSVEGNRQSVSSVSLDEEMSNMIQFQHAYNAAARNLTAVDEMLDRIINNMGLVGR
ncbi:flagellar hook-associated protein FlgK [Salipaludibacillus daqingensis]|uniref:flagellar hook-associated protein FlgK n=1 Tax=Salipaludibacillus daqingensis TaxID=3041001 RepID=UPI0024746D10|nr:flagellar hook-associated protein FlgK [Salipaludibacillus daqingensis]